MNIMPRWNYDTDEDRFWSKVYFCDNECWEWTASLHKDGYGNFHKKLSSGRFVYVLAHRYSYELWFGEIPEGMYVCHTCDNPKCVNPSHLFLGTQQDNMDDMLSKGRLNDRSGENNSRSKLTWDEVEFIRYSYSKGLYNQYVLAKMFDVS